MVPVPTLWKSGLASICSTLSNKADVIWGNISGIGSSTSVLQAWHLRVIQEGAHIICSPRSVAAAVYPDPPRVTFITKNTSLILSEWFGKLREVCPGIPNSVSLVIYRSVAADNLFVPVVGDIDP